MHILSIFINVQESMQRMQLSDTAWTINLIGVQYKMRKLENRKGTVCMEKDSSHQPYQQNQNCHGWILYAGTEQKVNRHYVDLYRNACRKYGMSVRLGFYFSQESFEGKAGQPIAEAVRCEKPAFVINRTRDWRLADWFEKSGIRVYNSSLVAKLGNDKLAAYDYMEQKGIPVMPYLRHTDKTLPWYPAVVKACQGHGGTQVDWISDEAAWQKWKQLACKTEEAYVVQQAVSDIGKDVRVYIVGNRIAACVLRTSRTDFRSNYCLGGEVSLYTLSQAERELVKKTVDGLPIGMAGIDFIFHHGKMIFNEIEDVAGARGLYALSDYDIIDEYIGNIWRELQDGGAV